ncbi:MAG: hypothetical protein ACPLSO_01805 [Fervidicoccaceae archaeon]
MPITKQTRKILRMHGVDVEHAVLFGGEEYEVVFTSSEDENEVMGSCREKGIRCMKIGKVLRGRGKVYFRGKELVRDGISSEVTNLLEPIRLPGKASGVKK